MGVLSSIKTWARRIKRDAVMLWFACRHPDTPRLIKAWCLFTVAYAFSPIDLIPDFIPVLGYLDEAILLPTMIWLATRFLPRHIREDCRIQAECWMQEQGAKPKSYLGALLIIVIWVLLIYLSWNWYSSSW